MHRSELSTAARLRRAPAWPQESGPLDVPRVAHLIVDMQNTFVEPGAPSEVAGGRDIIGNINRISRAVRDAGGLNVFLRFTVDPHESVVWRGMRRQVQTDALAAFEAIFADGAEGHALSPRMDRGAQDLVLNKTRFSAFTPGTCGLQDELAARGIETLIVSGMLTNCCCEATARDGMQWGYAVLMAQDACATHDDAMHNAALSSLYAFGYADVVTTEALLARLTPEAPVAPSRPHATRRSGAPAT
jgi:ureidoacrylate peracid hydrolase